MLRVLLIEDEAGAGVEAAHALDRAGHEVTSCRFPFTRALRCFEVGHSCPLAEDLVDVIVSARRHPRRHVGAGEAELLCGLHYDVPLILAGMSTWHPFMSEARVIAKSEDDIVAVCGSAARGEQS